MLVSVSYEYTMTSRICANVRNRQRKSIIKQTRSALGSGFSQASTGPSNKCHHGRRSLGRRRRAKWWHCVCVRAYFVILLAATVTAILTPTLELQMIFIICTVTNYTATTNAMELQIRFRQKYFGVALRIIPAMSDFVAEKLQFSMSYYNRKQN